MPPLARHGTPAPTTLSRTAPATHGDGGSGGRPARWHGQCYGEPFPPSHRCRLPLPQYFRFGNSTFDPSTATSSAIRSCPTLLTRCFGRLRAPSRCGPTPCGILSPHHCGTALSYRSCYTGTLFRISSLALEQRGLYGRSCSGTAGGHKVLEALMLPAWQLGLTDLRHGLLNACRNKYDVLYNTMGLQYRPAGYK